MVIGNYSIPSIYTPSESNSNANSDINSQKQYTKVQLERDLRDKELEKNSIQSEINYLSSVGTILNIVV